jgi:hypothetical protein
MRNNFGYGAKLAMPSIDDILANIRATVGFIGHPDWRGELASEMLDQLIENLREAVKEALANGSRR